MSINESIKCTVNNCKYNEVAENYCTLQQIQVGTHESNPSMDECTDCRSFKLK